MWVWLSSREPPLRQGTAILHELTVAGRGPLSRQSRRSSFALFRLPFGDSFVACQSPTAEQPRATGGPALIPRPLLPTRTSREKG